MPVSRDAVLEALAAGSRVPVSEKGLLRHLGLRREQLRFLRGVLQRLLAEGAIERAGTGFRRRGGARAPRSERAGRPEAPVRPGPALGRGRGAGRPARARPARAVDSPPEPLPPRTDWVGLFESGRRGPVVTPYRDDARWAVAIERGHTGGARDGDVVRVAPSQTRTRSPAPRGRVTAVLGRPGEPEADFAAVVWRHRLPVAFPADALAEAAGLADEPGAAELAGRLDLRGKPFVTVDPATARDHDDAVCVEPLAGGAARLWVAIADVAHHVAEGSALDREALRRGNSVYFPDRAIPMLPERLSGDVCSLRPERDRLVMAVSLDVSRSGVAGAPRFHAGVIRSRARLVYDDAARVMEGGAGSGATADPEIAGQLRALHAVSSKLLKRRFEAGSLDFDLPTAEIVLGDDGHPVDIVEAPRTVAHRAIEEAMLAANRAVAEALDAAEAPALYRVHEPPDPGKMEALEEVLGRFGLLPRRSKPPGPREIGRALAAAQGRPEARLVHLVALRSLKQARYHAEDRGHFALAFDHYTHFTSPIRRYADLVVHRALKGLLAGGPAAARAAAARAASLRDTAMRVSWRERAAMDAEREMVSMKKAGFLRGHVGEVCEGTVTGVAAFGMWVTLDPWFADGLVHVSRLPERVVFDERSFALVAARSGRRFGLGDRLRVRIERVDIVKAWVELGLVPPAGAGPGAGVRARPGPKAGRVQAGPKRRGAAARKKRSRRG